MTHLPEILAPAGDTQSFLAALAAGADAVYVGMKHFSARMQADNFSIKELAQMVELARREDRKVYIALNSMLKPNDPAAAGRLIARLARGVQPHALIMQDLGAVEMARQAGFEGEIHLSTLANITHPAALESARSIGADRVILPRELDIDEVRLCNDNCPEGLDLELFVHGALCFCVSGRCYWSSYMGGKSGLRGRCVQPCRRMYKQKSREGRYFSCLDLSLDVLARNLLGMENLSSWKIEGRKKGPHYVFYTVTAYRLLRDNPNDPKARKQAEDLLKQALSRPTTHARFLPQKQHPVTAPNDSTSSGQLVGKLTRDKKGAFEFKPRVALQTADFLRIGYEDDPWHRTVRVSKPVPKAGAFTLPFAKGRPPAAGIPVFLIDRREKDLVALLRQWEAKLNAVRTRSETSVDFEPELPARAGSMGKGFTVMLHGNIPKGRRGGRDGGVVDGVWLSPKSASISRTLVPRYSWWLPPVIWPNEEDQWKRLIVQVLRNGARHFVLGAPWQMALFPENAKIAPVAGPFCNISNPAALVVLERMGIRGAIVSPELSGEEVLSLPAMSPIPLGIVLSGYWPMGLTRNPVQPLKQGEPFYSPKREPFWARRYGQNTWLFPGWPLDITSHHEELKAAGYTIFVHMKEQPPREVPEPSRSSTFNWDLTLL
ncbi:U32 family peptidase [Oleidesulfovibrio sp.]|uniref:peptidase U32 family protein n=1 Tax=Oleidesulfovibrio sp. TaxID=2909707 RepID=UPI003A8883A8